MANWKHTDTTACDCVHCAARRKAEGSTAPIPPAPSAIALTALHRADIVNLLAVLDAVLDGKGNRLQEDDPATVADIRLRWDCPPQVLLPTPEMRWPCGGWRGRP
jgi:hypothetical protein